MRKLLFLLLFVCILPDCIASVPYGDYAVICKNGKYGVTYRDVVCVYPQYDSLFVERKEYKEGIAGAYMEDGKWGTFVDGNRTSAPVFDAIGGDDGLNEIVSYRSKILFNNGAFSYFYLLPVQSGGKWGYVDASGNYLIEPQYDRASCFTKTFEDNTYYALVEKDGGWYIIDLLGTVVSEDLRAKLDIDNSKKQGKNWDKAAKKAAKEAFKTHGDELTALATRLHEVYEASQTKLPAMAAADIKAEQSEGKWRLTGAAGRQLSPTLYDDVAEPEGNVVRVVKDGRYGLVDAARGEIVPCRFDYITEFDENGFAEVWNNGFTGHVSMHGHVDLEENLLKNAEDQTYPEGRDVTPIQDLLEYDPESVIGYLLLGEWGYRNNHYAEAYQAYDMAFELAEEQGKQKLLPSKTIRDICYDKAHGVEYEPEPSFLGILSELVDKTMEIRSSIHEIKHGTTSTSVGASGGVLPSAGMSGGGSYQSQYQRWENLAERHYNSITNTGLRSTTDSGEHNGKAGSMSASNYTQQKKAFRQAQREMARIRTKAAKEGVNIPQSKWETATISL